MVESDKQKTVISGTQMKQKREVAGREQREARVSDTKKDEVVTKQSNQERATMSRFIGEEGLTMTSIYQNPFELSSLNGTDGFQVNGISPNDRSGYSVSGAGDVNGDGIADLIIGAPYASPDGRLWAGQSFVVFGQSSFSETFELSQLNGANGFQINGIAANDESGWSVSGAGDVNKDGYADIIIGARWASPNGHTGASESYVVFGQSSFSKTFELSQLNGVNGFQINGIATYDFAGRSVSGAGDVNGDGYADLIIGAYGASPNGRSLAGESYVVFGQSSFGKTVELSQLNGVNGFQLNGIAANDWSGYSVSGAGDVNKDGYADLIVGAIYASPNDRIKAGESYVIFGRSSFSKTFELSQLNGANGFQINGITAGDYLGQSVSDAGDVNKDGYTDLILGAPYAAPSDRFRAGESFVVFGRSSFGKTFELSQLNGVNGFQINGIAAGDYSGWAVSGAGDVNQDGYADFIVGAQIATPDGRSQAGESFMVFGQSSFDKTFELSQLNGTNGFQINGIAAKDSSGKAVSDAGDVNKDGYADIIIGASGASPNGRYEAGESYLVFGGGVSSNIKRVPFSKNEVKPEYPEEKSKEANAKRPEGTYQNNPLDDKSVLTAVTSGLKKAYQQGKQYIPSFWSSNRVSTANTSGRDLSASEMDRLEKLTKIEKTLTQLTKTLHFGEQVDLYQNSESLMNALAFYQTMIANRRDNVKSLSAQDMKDLQEDVMKLRNAVMGANTFTIPDAAAPSKRNVEFFNPMNVREEVGQPMLGAQNNMKLRP